jgi:hypothetical protein
MKYAGTVLSLHIFKGVLHFATRPLYLQYVLLTFIFGLWYAEKRGDMKA